MKSNGRLTMTFYMIMYSMQNFSHQIAWCQHLPSVYRYHILKEHTVACVTEKVSMLNLTLQRKITDH